jgi:alpha-ketoglutarate-dependent taurine dioxygenase
VENLIFPLWTNEKIDLKNLFNKYPLIIFRNINKVLEPSEFINFLTIFDPEYDKNALENPRKYPNQILQPFDQLPIYKHIAPRGNFFRKEIFGIKNLNVTPSAAFINNYVWHTDLLGHPEKNPGIVTGFYIMKSPVIGGETDFISAETIYENLDKKSMNMIKDTNVIINRHNFALGNKIMDYSGSYRIKDSDLKFPKYNVQIPMLFQSENKYQTNKVLLMPSFVENIVGLTNSQTDFRMKYLMENSILPYRFSIKWKDGDLCVFNNRCFLHSSTPARNYLELEKNERILLQVFLPTNNKFVY